MVADLAAGRLARVGAAPPRRVGVGRAGGARRRSGRGTAAGRRARARGRRGQAAGALVDVVGRARRRGRAPRRAAGGRLHGVVVAECAGTAGARAGAPARARGHTLAAAAGQDLRLMARVRTLVIVLAGGAGGRLELLTQRRAKPAVPFAGTHRLIDFPLSNCHNAGLADVWVAQQFNPISLSDHLANGRPWDPDRTTGGLLILQPRLGHDEREGFQKGTADSLWRNTPLVREFAPDAVVVVSADAVYAMDYGALVEEHMESKAAVTIVTTKVDPGDASRYGVVQVDGERGREYVYKPEDPASDVVANEVFVFRPQALLDGIDELAEQAGEEGLEDIGDELLPRLVGAGDARAHAFEGYWRDVGTVEAYWACHQDLLGDEPPVDLDDAEWPILTHAASR